MKGFVAKRVISKKVIFQESRFSDCARNSFLHKSKTLSAQKYSIECDFRYIVWNIGRPSLSLHFCIDISIFSKLAYNPFCHKTLHMYVCRPTAIGLRKKNFALIKSF